MIRWFGGGNVKLYAALALWCPLGDGPRLLVAVAFAEFFVALACIIYARTRKKKERVRSLKDRRIPYGVAIAVGGLLMMANAPALAIAR